jgi:hypothetical protein
MQSHFDNGVIIRKWCLLFEKSDPIPIYHNCFATVIKRNGHRTMIRKWCLLLERSGPMPILIEKNGSE